jgi:hypothetical protein
MAKLSGEVTRRPVDDVMAELEAAEEATEAAAKEARKKMREQRKAEVSEKFSERVGKLEGTAPHLLDDRTMRLRARWCGSR